MNKNYLTESTENYKTSLNVFLTDSVTLLHNLVIQTLRKLTHWASN